MTKYLGFQYWLLLYFSTGQRFCPW